MKRLLLLPLLLGLWALPLSAQEDFKVIGYFPDYRFGYSDQINFSQLTHLNIAFANPLMDGSLEIGLNNRDITPVVALARQHGLTVLLSMGGALTTEWRQAWQSWMLPSKRSGFIHTIMEYVRAHSLDGIDMDLEGPDVNYLYSPFVLELRDSLDAEGKLLTVALPGIRRDADITDEALAAFDWVNMMVYNLTGPWAPNLPGPHSPFEFAVNSISFWLGQGVPRDKLTLGVPFYGWDFASNPVSSFTYRTMVELNPANAFTDQAGLAFYNGIPTIQAKTQLALEEIAGIMIWEIGQDSYTEFSLLNAIHETVNPPTVIAEAEPVEALSVFPNPFGDQLSVENRSGGLLQLRLNAMDGRPAQQFSVGPHASQWLNTSSLAPGMYVLQVVGREANAVYKILRR